MQHSCYRCRNGIVRATKQPRRLFAPAVPSSIAQDCLSQEETQKATRAASQEGTSERSWERCNKTPPQECPCSVEAKNASDEPTQSVGSDLNTIAKIRVRLVNI
mmetsp:Transcript_3323/g.8866  ORF Transcript_3323/g.8866 Transcript_3323/m.8866 type:complete len:104 (-) Transcript_3323:412-723(-)